MTTAELKNPSFGKRLRELASWRGHNQTTLYVATGISKGEMSRLWRGEREDAGATKVLEICEVLRCEPRYLVFGMGRRWLPGEEPKEKPASPDKRRVHNRDRVASVTREKSQSGSHDLTVIRHAASSSAPPRIR